MKLLFVSLFFFSFQVFAKPSAYQNALEDVRIALMDIRKAYSEQKIELELLQEKMKKSHSSNDLDTRIAQLEKTQEKILSDLRSLSGHANQTNHALTVLEKQVEQITEKIGEVVKLKSTLQTISKSIGSNGKIHKVSPGDSLEKIARKYNTSVENIKQANGLQNHTIIIGQELRIP